MGDGVVRDVAKGDDAVSVGGIAVAGVVEWVGPNPPLAPPPLGKGGVLVESLEVADGSPPACTLGGDSGVSLQLDIGHMFY